MIMIVIGLTTTTIFWRRIWSIFSIFFISVYPQFKCFESFYIRLQTNEKWVKFLFDPWKRSMFENSSGWEMKNNPNLIEIYQMWNVNCKWLSAKYWKIFHPYVKIPTHSRSHTPQNIEFNTINQINIFK